MLKVQLDDFRAQRAAGMGGMFGPPDPKLRAAEETVDRRLAVINKRLVPLLDSMVEDLENASEKVKKGNSSKIWCKLPESCRAREKAGLSSSLDLRTNLQVRMGSKNPSRNPPRPRCRPP